MERLREIKKISDLNPADLNCNIFSCYDYDSLTIQELLCQFFTRINECITEVNNTYDLYQWLKNEGLAIEVANTLIKWKDDHTLDNIINQTLLAEINKKLEKRVRFYLSYDAMMADRKNVEEDASCITQGYYTPKDGGGAEYIKNGTDGFDIVIKDGILDIRQMGAKAQVGFNSTQKIKDCITALKDEQTLLIPDGKYEFNLPIVCEKAINIQCKGSLLYKGVGVAFTYGATTKKIASKSIELTISNNTVDWTTHVQGLKLININHCTIYPEVNNFTRGLILDGYNNFGVQYNIVNIKSLYNNKESLVMLASDTHGWCNQNTFIGGSMGWESSQTVTDENIHVNMLQKSDNKLNNNIFINLSFERGTLPPHTPAGKSMVINGNHNIFYNCRYEGVRAIEFDTKPDTVNNLIEGGFNLSEIALINQKGSNIVNTKNRHTFAGEDQTTANVFRNLFSDNSKALSVNNATNNNEVFYIKGNGEVSTNEFLYTQRGIRYSKDAGDVGTRGLFIGDYDPNGNVKALGGSLYAMKKKGDGNLLYIKQSDIDDNTKWTPLQVITTTTPPTTGLPAGYCVFDTGTGKPKWWKPNTGQWVDAQGQPIP